MPIDHVILAATDPDAAAARLEAEHCLVATGGGRHGGVGTHNRIVPFGGGYLELMAVADPQEAQASALGRILGRAVPAVLHRARSRQRRSGRGRRRGGITRVEVAGDAERLAAWLGGKRLPVRVLDGPPALRAVGIGDRELR